MPEELDQYGLPTGDEDTTFISVAEVRKILRRREVDFAEFIDRGVVRCECGRATLPFLSETEE